NPPAVAAAMMQRITEQRAQESAEFTARATWSWRLWVKRGFSALVPWLVALWFVGVLFLSLRFLGGLVVMRRLKRREASPMLEQWQERLAALCQQLRVSRPVRLCESVLVEVPTVIGWL